MSNLNFCASILPSAPVLTILSATPVVVNEPPVLTISAKLIALASPVPEALLANTVFCAISGKSAKSTALAASVTQPSVTVKSSASNAASPRSDCAIPVALALVVAACIASLLWSIPAVGLTSPLTITSELIAAVATLLPLLVNTTSPVTV